MAKVKPNCWPLIQLWTRLPSFGLSQDLEGNASRDVRRRVGLAALQEQQRAPADQTPSTDLSHHPGEKLPHANPFYQECRIKLDEAARLVHCGAL